MKAKLKDSDSAPQSPVYLKLQPFERPSFADTLMFPDSIIELASSNVSDLIGKYAKMTAYVNQEQTLAMVELLHLKHEEAKLRARLSRARPATKKPKWERDLEQDDTDPELKSIVWKKIQAEGRLKMAEMYKDNFDRFVMALSRELTRKIGDEQRSGINR